MFVFLEAIGTKERWTFFAPRDPETDLGQAFRILTKQLLKNAEARFCEYLKRWLKSDDYHLRWFAAEIIGFHGIQRLRKAVEEALQEPRVPEERWPDWYLNLCWALASLDAQPATAFSKLLESAKNADNRRWILTSFDQMLGAEKFLSKDDAKVLAKALRQRFSGRDREVRGLEHVERVIAGE
jgi:hypothetical protein